MLLEIYEEMFDHQSFTGRSGTFFGYEGLGSIYWHMVSKLLLATQETYLRGGREACDPALLGRLQDHYYEIKAGIGLYKLPEVYGAFPTDAYSHTPDGAGVKQPGLTGQVKEDVISRLFELGIEINDGQISFRPSLLNKQELMQESKHFVYYDLNGDKKELRIGEKQMVFTYCQVPVIYEFDNHESIKIHYSDGLVQQFEGCQINKEISRSIFERSGEVQSIACTFQDKV